MKNYCLVALITILAGMVMAGGLVRIDDSPVVYLDKTFESINTQINDQVATTEVECRFQSSISIDTRLQFIFPLPENASVFEAEIFRFGVWHTCTLRTVVDSTDSGIGTGGISGSSDPYLGDNAFALELGNMIPEDVRVRFSYIQLLEYDKGNITYYYPWHPHPEEPSLLDTLIQVITLNSSRTIDSLRGDVYLGVHEETATYYHHEFVDFMFSDEDSMTISYHVNSSEISFSSMFFKDDSHDGYFLFLIEPPVEIDSSEIIAKDFTFVLDKSGSMSGTKIEQAKNAAIGCIELLNPEDRFNVVYFSNDVTLFSSEGLVPANDYYKNLAIAEIGRVTAGGGTNAYGGLLDGLELYPADRMSEMIFLTDGRPTSGYSANPNVIRTDFHTANLIKEVQLFSVGIGYDVDSSFLANIAFENWGEYIPVHSSDIETAIAELISYINFPLLANPEIDIPLVDVYDVYPVELPTVFSGKQLVITGRYRTPNTTDITLSGDTPTGYTEYTYEDITFPSYSDSLPFIKTVWAQQLIHYWISWMDANGEADSLIDKVIATSLQYGVACRYTEYLHEEPVDTTGTGGDESIFEDQDVQAIARNTENGILFNITIPNAFLYENIELQRSRYSNKAFHDVASIVSGQPFTDTDLKSGDRVYYRVRMQKENGEYKYSDVIEMIYVHPDEIAIASAFPNPFNSAVHISVLGKTDNSAFDIYDTHGRIVNSITPYGNTKEITWNGLDFRANKLESGVYLVKPRNSSQKPTKVILVE